MILGDLQDGIVIDHIPVGEGMHLYHHLGLDKLDAQVALIERASSEKIGRKDILKIAKPMDLDFDLLGYFDPHITVSIVREGKIVEKKHPRLPETLTDILHCHNPRCITSIEQELPHVFRLTDPEKKIYRCIYCETIGKPEE
ncbi:MAG: aspartate carbamoyltransferase regulatory subunit [Peptoniphilaceae bacterium]|nr:aspartate carbamoyltransferase regulatory subunit [Peptoniphilaceae bacterium]MCI6660148.1 aspartate carbamoyltransferase regulatory subunit [Peptoniphilaceae bacterium]MDD7433465.1 aspartate carbamoyltransferase regulatory subunit [Peptoniphilaceae bacterium]MDY3076231.1 aspartate carbamoyltransferase regulatory subunit [Peptoniphilaceae bacterium]MDY4196360.1 aspartate carbamoyltransferase regulatory subunit [Peptoniphilaceae bacterium]